MNAKLANILKTIFIETQNWKDISAGLVKDYEMTKSYPSRDGKKIVVKKRFPISCELSQVECQKGDYTILTPDSKKRAITYFEDLGTTPTGRNGGHEFSMISNIRLVCWLNMNMFGYNECSISNRLIISIMDQIPENYYNYNGFDQLKIELVRIVPKNAGIFSRYTYDEPITQYLLKPYDYFAIDFRASYKINSGCFDAIVLGDDPCHPQSLSPSGGEPVLKGKLSHRVQFRTDPIELEYDIEMDVAQYKIESFQFGQMVLDENQYSHIGTKIKVIDPNADTDGDVFVNIELTRR